MQDLYLIHWPIKFEDETVPQPMRLPSGWPVPEIKASFEFKNTWKYMCQSLDREHDDYDSFSLTTYREALMKEGLVKAIGVSNFTVEQLEELQASCEITPAVNQVEFHPYLVQTRLLDYCKAKGETLVWMSSLQSKNR